MTSLYSDLAMYRGITLGVLVAIIPYLKSFAQTQDAQSVVATHFVFRCREMSDERERLSCYDKEADEIRRLAESERAREEQGASALSVSDLILDKLKFFGKEVSVAGLMSCMGDDYCVIADRNAPTTNINVDATELARPDRKRLMECNVLKEDCGATVQGTFRASTFGVELRARKIFWEAGAAN